MDDPTYHDRTPFPPNTQINYISTSKGNIKFLLAKDSVAEAVYEQYWTPLLSPEFQDKHMNDLGSEGSHWKVPNSDIIGAIATYGDLWRYTEFHRKNL
jgi:hypothetical protein